MRAILGLLLAVITILLAACNSANAMEYSTAHEKMAPSEVGRFDRGDAFATSGVDNALASLNAGSVASQARLGNVPTGPSGSGALMLVAANLPPGDAPVITADVSATAPAMNRSIIYTAGLRMVVADIRVTQSVIQQQAVAAGGYLQELDGNAITVRIPAAKFDATLAAFERLGEVTNRKVKANDVTEEMRDLRIRLENAETTRKRLAELIAKADKVEDTIKLEAELEKVTETIELIKGKLQYMQDQLAFSTIRFDLNSPRQQGQGGFVVALPFSWIKELGDGAVAGVSEPTADTNRLFKRNERFALPQGFVRYFERDHVTEAMSADEVIIKLRRQDNYDGGDLSFWGKLARKALVENRAIAIDKESDAKVKDGSTGHLMSGIKDLGARKQGYILGIVSTQRYVYTFEAWGDSEKITAQHAALEAAFASLDVKHW